MNINLFMEFWSFEETLCGHLGLKPVTSLLICILVPLLDGFDLVKLIKSNIYHPAYANQCIRQWEIRSFGIKILTYAIPLIKHKFDELNQTIG